MAKIKSVKFNFIMNFILTISSVVFPLLTFPYVSRVLGADGNGKIAFITSVANYFSMIASLGIPTYGIRACAAVRDDKEKLSKTAQELLIVNSLMTLVSLAVYFGSMFFVDRLYQEKELMVIQGISILLNVIGVSWLFSALEQYQYITTRSLAFKIISLIMMFALVHRKEDYVLYAAISVLAAAGSNILNFVYARKHITLRPFKDYNLRQHMKPILLFFAQSVAITVYTNLDTVMLGFMKNDAEVGLYTAAVKVKTILVYFVTSLGTVLLPRLSYFVNNGKLDEFKKMIRVASEFVLLISLPLAAYFMVMAEESILLLSGEGFLGAVLGMQIIILSIVFIGLSNVTGIQFLTPLNKEKSVLWSVIVGAVVDLILNLIFIPEMGAAGAALGTAVAELSVLLVQLYLIKREFQYQIFEFRKCMKIFMAVVIAMVPLLILKTTMVLHVFLELLVTALVFFGGYLLACLILKIDLVKDTAMQILKRK